MIGWVLGTAMLASCATVEEAPERAQVPAVNETAQQVALVPEAPRLKRKIAVARFSNSTRYGKGLLYDGENDPLADQAKDMLVQRLIESQQFLVFERDNLDSLAFERSLSDGGDAFQLVGVDAVIVGSVTEFGRKTDGRSGFLSSTKRQTAVATVEARLVDPKTGLAFFSGSGNGEASVEAGEVAGFGSRAGYDASLNDSAISAAVSDLTSDLVGNLTDRPWTTDILQTDGANVYISGGSKQGLQIGDVLAVEAPGKTITSQQTGLPIQLPGQVIASIQVSEFFGDTEYSEGAITRIVSGSTADHDVSTLIVKEAN
jgi:curli biogenesis system outer membrane secretion channel CsgG